MDGLISSRIQLLDQEHSVLEYVRDKASLCCDQAKVTSDNRKYSLLGIVIQQYHSQYIKFT